MRSNFDRFNPTVDKRVLIVLAGIIWSIVGIMLCRLAVRWLSETTMQNAVWLGSAGFILSLIIHHFMFLKLLYKNIDRILSKEDKVCVFAFQSWKSYLIILFMIFMGLILRHSPIPKPYLSIIYIGFGGAMVLSSLVYYWNFFRYLKQASRNRHT
ncbi:MAG: hypothetical protein HZB61_01305 [Nitrospirae bacterium]|nr:hypothetical protein [Nitrospirota bacterium]